MIKTVSFAPPRAAGSRSSVKSAGAKTTPIEALRPANPRPSSGRKPKAPAQASLELLFDAPEPPQVESVAPVKTIKPTLKLKSAPAEKPAIVAEPLAELPKTPTAAKKVRSGEVKAKKARVPKDFAAQYGEKAVVRVAAPPVEAPVTKKRLTKVERQARRDLIKPSEGLLERLARVNQIAARKPKSEPRGKGWKFLCGRCGTTSYFETPGGLCACGAIAIKE